MKLILIMISLLLISCQEEAKVKKNTDEIKKEIIDYEKVVVTEENLTKLDMTECKVIQYVLKTKEGCIEPDSPEHFCNLLKRKIRKNEFYFIQKYIKYDTTLTNIEYIFYPDTTVKSIEYLMHLQGKYNNLKELIRNAPVKARGRIYFKENQLVIENVMNREWKKINKKIDKIQCEVYNTHSFVIGRIFLDGNPIELKLDRPYKEVFGEKAWLDLTKD
jgi:hypothetical protein